jgi:GH35 family endo-1,4-beta-xylanase
MNLDIVALGIETYMSELDVSDNEGGRTQGSDRDYAHEATHYSGVRVGGCSLDLHGIPPVSVGF